MVFFIGKKNCKCKRLNVPLNYLKLIKIVKIKKVKTVKKEEIYIQDDSFSCVINYIQLNEYVIKLLKTLNKSKNLKCITYESDFKYKIVKYPVFSLYINKINIVEYSFYGNCSYIDSYVSKFDTSNNYITISNFIIDVSNNRYYDLTPNYVFDLKYKKIFYKSYYFFDFFDFCIKNITPPSIEVGNYLYVYCIFIFNGISCIKIGYTSDLFKINKSLKTPFSDSKLYLIFWCKVEDEFIEQQFHEIMRIYHPEYIIENIYVIKTDAISKEIYKFDLHIMSILSSYLKECYYKEEIEMKNLENKQFQLKLDCKKIKLEKEKIKLEKEKIEFEKEKIKANNINKNIELEKEKQKTIKLQNKFKK
jgi:hypothetical protein